MADATITSDTGDATTKTAALPSIARQRCRLMAAEMSIQRWGVRWDRLAVLLAAARGSSYVLYEVKLSALRVGHLPVLRQRSQWVFRGDLRFCEGLLSAVRGGDGRIVQTTGWSIFTSGVRPEDAAAALVLVIGVTCTQQR